MSEYPYCEFQTVDRPLTNTHLYQRAECFLPWNLHKKVFNSTLFPYWSNEDFYYFSQTPKENLLIKVNIATGKKENIFSFQKLLNALSLQLKYEVPSEKLPLDKFFIPTNETQLHFIFENHNWCYDVEKDTCIKITKISPEYLKSPDNNWSLSVKNYNLILTDLIKNNDFQLTSDGEHYYDYASSPETNTRAVSQRLDGSISSPIAIWSPNSQKIITHKLDQRKVRSLSLLQNAPPGSQRPKLHNYRMSFSGDTHLPLAELLIIDVLTKEIISVKTEPLLSPYLTPIEFKWVWWDESSKKVFFLREARGAKTLMLCVADAETGETKTLITEVAKTYADPNPLFPYSLQVIILEEKQEIIWLSERSGYAHLYLYEYGSDTPKHSITQGEWCVREVHFYDTKTGWLYFTACGYTKNSDPYYKQLFRCHLDGSELQLLTEADFHHTIHISPNQDCFLDTYSTINTPPISLLKKMDGTTICHIETADITGLTKLGWVPPKRFHKKARDHITDVYGNLYFPTHFDPNKKYPIIDHIYPGPQIYRTSPNFNLYGAIYRSAWTAQALAELGFIVIHMDGFGTPGRSKAFHDATYQNMSDCGIPDHVYAIKQLAEEYDFIDLDKVGITGYSGGGYAAVRAMLMYPDFFKVGVSAGGNHDLRCYPANYGEKYNSLDTTTYADQSNAILAEKLQGKLLLIHGEMDDNVHPCATFQLVDALIKHNKNFDMLIMPNQNHHSTFDHPYYMRRHWNYFVQNLLGQVPPENYLFSSMPEEFPQINDW